MTHLFSSFQRHVMKRLETLTIHRDHKIPRSLFANVVHMIYQLIKYKLKGHTFFVEIELISIFNYVETQIFRFMEKLSIHSQTREISRQDNRRPRVV